jgi:tetrahydrodipicolinate N-succinyltransferase
MENKKFELTDETIEHYGRTLHRIRALKDFGYVTKGELGGWIEKEENLSHDGTCWIFHKARVFDNAQVGGNAEVYDYARVYGNARVFDSARVRDHASVYGNACVHGRSWVWGSARVYDDTRVLGNAQVKDRAVISGTATITSKEDLVKYLEEQKNKSKSTGV